MSSISRSTASSCSLVHSGTAGSETVFSGAVAAFSGPPAALGGTLSADGRRRAASGAGLLLATAMWLLEMAARVDRPLTALPLIRNRANAEAYGGDAVGGCG